MSATAGSKTAKTRVRISRKRLSWPQNLFLFDLISISSGSCAANQAYAATCHAVLKASKKMLRVVNFNFSDTIQENFVVAESFRFCDEVLLNTHNYLNLGGQERRPGTYDVSLHLCSA